MTLNPVTLTFDPVGSLLGPSLILMHFVEIGLGVLEILKFFQYDLDPVTLTSDLIESLLQPSPMHKRSLDKFRPRVFEILTIFSP